MAQHNDLGKWGEEQAATFLERKGYTICDRDWRAGHRDLDIIALNEDQTILVIVEVKTRTSAELNEPEEAVNRKKIRNIGNAANLYLKQFNVEYDVRFDIVSVTGTSDSNAKIEHIIDAFNPLLT
ncbi:YraN family protein [Hoylesella pleuritidis]|jgi:TIGR00252 family protein|uniref:YraN family protein n=1 Tax=Hoylesella pleuritidis TaxID=407975 RepID=UPI000469321D|nr:YraN family protein [Hoylesella pleuritidis]